MWRDAIVGPNKAAARAAGGVKGGKRQWCGPNATWRGCSGTAGKSWGALRHCPAPPPLGIQSPRETPAGSGRRLGHTPGLHTGAGTHPAVRCQHPRPAPAQGGRSPPAGDPGTHWRPCTGLASRGTPRATAPVRASHLGCWPWSGAGAASSQPAGPGRVGAGSAHASTTCFPHARTRSALGHSYTCLPAMQRHVPRASDGFPLQHASCGPDSPPAARTWGRVGHRNCHRRTTDAGGRGRETGPFPLQPSERGATSTITTARPCSDHRCRERGGCTQGSCEGATVGVSQIAVRECSLHGPLCTF